MSDLSKFCKAVLEAINLPEEKQPSWFAPFFGLCSNSRYYDIEFGTEARTQLKEIFKGEEYPFNDSNSHEYDRESEKETTYKNKQRLAFLNKHAYSDAA